MTRSIKWQQLPLYASHTPARCPIVGLLGWVCRRPFHGFCSGGRLLLRNAVKPDQLLRRTIARDWISCSRSTPVLIRFRLLVWRLSLRLLAFSIPSRRSLATGTSPA